MINDEIHTVHCQMANTTIIMKRTPHAYFPRPRNVLQGLLVICHQPNPDLRSPRQRAFSCLWSDTRENERSGPDRKLPRRNPAVARAIGQGAYVFFTVTRHFYPWAPGTHPVSVPILHPRDIRYVGRSYETREGKNRTPNVLSTKAETTVPAYIRSA